jgi:hypothetical protein
MTKEPDMKRIGCVLAILVGIVSTAGAGGVLSDEDQAFYRSQGNDGFVFGWCQQYNTTPEGYHEYWIDFYYNGIADGWKYYMGGFDVAGIQNFSDGEFETVRDIWSEENFGRGTDVTMPESVHVVEDYKLEYWAAFRHATSDDGGVVNTDRLTIWNVTYGQSGSGPGLLMTWRLVFDQPYYDGDLWVAASWTADNPLKVFNMPTDISMPGDFDNDGDIDADDIDLLMANLGGDPAVYDLTNDGVVDQDDVDEWVFNIVPIGENIGTVYGDFNLDGEVNAGDLALLATNYGTVGDWGWATGDGNGDGNVDAGDLAMLATNYGTVVHPVPEPITMSLLAVGGAVLLRRRK